MAAKIWTNKTADLFDTDSATPQASTNTSVTTAPAVEPAPAVQAEQATPSLVLTAQSKKVGPEKKKVVPEKKKAPTRAAKDLEADPRFLTDPINIALLSEIVEWYPDSEIVLDFETTALTPWSAEAHPGPNLVIGDTGIHIKEYAGTINPRPRARILSIAIPDAGYTAALDLDALSDDQKHNLAEALTGAVWVGHNLQFDYQWMLTINPNIKPARIIDTMLLVAACRPQADIEMQGVVAEHVLRGGTVEPRKCLAELQKKVIERAEMDKTRSKEEDGGAMPLQALSLWLLDEDMEKSYQKPHNWMLDKLSLGHYDYVMGDVTAPGLIARRLMKIPDNASTAELLAAIDNHRGGQAYHVFEEAIHALMRMQRTGIRWDLQAAQALDAELSKEAKDAADELAKIAPSLTTPIVIEGKPTKKNPFPDPTQIDVLDVLTDPEKGMPTPVKKAIADALLQETGRSVAFSDAGNPVLDAKALAFDFPGSRIVAALAAVNAPTQARSMLDKFTCATVNERLHPLVSIKTKTGRTAAQEPSLQQVPRDPRFRAVFKAAPGNKIIATDYSSIELRIAAALGVRAWREFKSVIAWATGANREDVNRPALPLYKNIKWLIKNRNDELDEALLTWLSDDTLVEVPDQWQMVERPGRGAPISDIRAYKVSQLCLWVSRIRKVSGGDEAKLPFIAAYKDGIDPHLLTAAAMEAQSGKLDTGGLLPSIWIRSQDQHELKKQMKKPRQAAKAVNFGSLYGQQATGLHRYGATSFGLDWAVEDAAMARDAWFALYPEIGLWHWMTQEAHKQKADILDPYNSNAFRLRDDTETGTGMVYWGTTLSGRPTVSSKTTGALSFQDQGTGAEIALEAIGRLPEDVRGMLVNFVHDELVLEVPEGRVDEVQAVVEKTMIEASDRYLLPFGVPTEVESAVDDFWVH